MRKRSAEEERLLAEQSRLRAELDAVNDALLAERFRDVPRRAAGDLVLVPRLLFGKRRLWPAQISYVHLNFMEGTDADGEDWVNRIVSYGVYLQQKDGSYGGHSEGYYDVEVQDMPAEVSQS